VFVCVRCSACAQIYVLPEEVGEAHGQTGREDGVTGVHRRGRGEGLSIPGSELGDEDDGDDDAVDGDSFTEDDAAAMKDTELARVHEGAEHREKERREGVGRGEKGMKLLFANRNMVQGPSPDVQNQSNIRQERYQARGGRESCECMPDEVLGADARRLDGSTEQGGPGQEDAPTMRVRVCVCMHAQEACVNVLAAALVESQ
jgi:hypothetical protein